MSTFPDCDGIPCVHRLFVLTNNGDAACCYALDRGDNVRFVRPSEDTPSNFLREFPVGEVVNASVEAQPSV